MATDNSTEIFGRKPIMPVRPITADMAVIVWAASDGSNPAGVTGATNLTISYQQQVIRRRTLATANGQPVAVIYPSQPTGSIQIQRLFADLSQQLGSGGATGLASDSTGSIFGYPGWNICNGTATITVTFDGASAYANCSTSTGGYRMTGALVTGYNISAEAEGLTVVDNVSIEFLQMFQAAASGSNTAYSGPNTTAPGSTTPNLGT